MNPLLPVHTIPPDKSYTRQTGSFSVTCEEIKDEDIMANQRTRCQWLESGQTSFILEQIQDSDLPAMTHNSHNPINTVDNSEEWLPPINIDDIDAESEIDDGDDERGDYGDNNEDPDAGVDRSTRDYCFELRRPPSIAEARAALEDLRLLLKPPHCRDRDKAVNGSRKADISPVLKERLAQMKIFLWLY